MDLKTFESFVLADTVTNSVASPLRKSQLSNIHNTINLLQHDDNAERLQRRSLIGNKMDFPEMNGIIKIGEQQLIHDHFQLCVKMFVENKINTKNVWNLKAIDYMEAVLQFQSNNKNFLHIGGTSLDVCSKVYSLKVDDLYASGLHLAGSITQSNVKLKEIGNPDEEKGSENHKKNYKKKPKKNRQDLKNTVVKDLKSITGNISKLDLNYFQTRIGVDTGNTSLLFTNTLQMHPISYKFLLISNQEPWVSYSNLSTKLASDLDRSYIWPLKCTENELIICKAFTDFEINRWNPDENDSCIMLQSFDVIINEKGLPVAELDGSIHDSFIIINDIQGLDDENNPQVQYKIFKEPEHILTFKPEDHATICNEYSYARCDSLINNNRNAITQMWAGPSHWKLKYICPAVSKFSGTDQKHNNGKREKLMHSPLNFCNCPKMPTGMYKSKKTWCVQNAGRLTFPENHVHQTFTDFGIKLASKSFVIYQKNSKKMTTSLEDDLPFNYKNANDSEYCCENNDNNEQSSLEFEEGKNITYDIVEEVENNENFVGGNLVSCPEIVQKSFIPYHLKAKKLDIRQLKNAVWKCIGLEDVNSSVKKNFQVAREPILFSDIYKAVPNLLSKKLKEELSLPITFVAFLHLVNEHNLKIEKHINDITDFKIKIE